MEKTSGTRNCGQLSLQLLALSVAAGCVAGLGAILFRAMIGLIHNLAFFDRFSFAYDANLHTDPSPLGAAIILVPVAGALGVAWLVKSFAPEAKGHGVPEVNYSNYYQQGRIRPAVALVKSLASALSIGSGGSVGREGPIIQIGAAFGSTLSQWHCLPEWQRTTLIACGAGGGIAATFNTPLGGLLFAVELIMTEISARTLVPVVLAVVTSVAVGRLYFGDHPSFLIPPLDLQVHQGFGLEVVAAYLMLGMLLGLGAMVMIMEMTLEYHAVLPLMLVVGSAYGVRRLLMQDSIYSMKLSRRDQPVPQSLHTAYLFLRSVADLADTPTRETEERVTASARVHQVPRRDGVITALWPAGMPEPVPALALAPHTRVPDAVGFLRAAGAEAVVITSGGDPRGPAMGP